MTKSDSVSQRPATVIYDGTCRFCVAGSARLLRLAAPGTLERKSMHDADLFEKFPSLTPEMCEKAMQLILPDGSVHSGVGAIVESLATRRWLRWLRWIYGVRPARVTLDWLYGFVARNRHRIMGRVPDSCESGACRLPSHPSK